MDDCLQNIFNFDILDWQHDRFRVMTQVGLYLRQIPSLNYLLRPGNLQIYNQELYSEKEQLIFEQLKKIIQTTDKISPSDYYKIVDKLCLQLNNSKNKALRLTYSECLESILSDVLQFQDNDKTEILLVYRDRGNQVDYHQRNLFKFDLIQRKSFNEAYWQINSYYKQWLLYETSSCNFLYLEKILSICYVDIYDQLNVLRENQLECYGYIYSFFVVLEQNLLRVIKLDNEYEIIEKLYLCFTIYIKHHWGKDTLKDSEILANMGRVSRFYKNQLVPIILNSGITNIIPQYTFIYFFKLASRIAPYETERKYDYHATAFMMHQNQSVEGVTNDSFEIPWIDVERVCGEYIKHICNYVTNKYLIQRSPSTCQISRNFYKVQDDPSSGFRNRNNKEFIKYFDIYNQLSDFASKGFTEEPFKPFYFKYQDLLRNIGMSNIDTISEPSIRKDGSSVISVTFKNLCYIAEGSEIINIKRMHVDIDEKKQLKSIFLYLLADHGIYKMFSRIKKERVFFGIPCFPIMIYDTDTLLPKMILRVLFRDNFDFGFDMVK